MIPLFFAILKFCSTKHLLSLSSTTNFLWQFSMTSIPARVDGQPASFDNFFIDKYICPCKSATSFFDNFLLSYWPAIFEVLTDFEFHKLSQLCRVSKCVDVAASPPKHPTSSHQDKNRLAQKAQSCEGWEVWDLVKLVKFICRAVYTSNFHIWQFFIWQVHLSKSWHASFWTSRLVIWKIVIWLHLQEQIKIVIEKLVIENCSWNLGFKGRICTDIKIYYTAHLSLFKYFIHTFLQLMLHRW